MPELPDIQVYVEQLAERLVGQPLTAVTIAKPFVLRSVDPPIADAVGRRFTGIRRSGKRIVLVLDTDRFLVIHLMIAGRLHWRPPNAKLSGRQALLALDFPSGSLTLTEAGSKRRASLHVLKGEQALRDIDPGGVDIFASDLDQLTIGNIHTDSVEEIIRSARKHPIVGTIFRKGLSALRDEILDLRQPVDDCMVHSRQESIESLQCASRAARSFQRHATVTDAVDRLWPGPIFRRSI